MTKTEETANEPRSHATVSPDRNGWVVILYNDGHQEDLEVYTFRWYARWMARRKVARMNKGPEIIR